MSHELPLLSSSSEALVQEKEAQLAAVKSSLNRLVPACVAQEIDRETFVAQKEELLAKKKRCQKAIRQNEDGKMGWIEPFKKRVNTAKTLKQKLELPESKSAPNSL